VVVHLAEGLSVASAEIIDSVVISAVTRLGEVLAQARMALVVQVKLMVDYLVLKRLIPFVFGKRVVRPDF